MQSPSLRCHPWGFLPVEMSDTHTPHYTLGSNFVLESDRQLPLWVGGAFPQHCRKTFGDQVAFLDEEAAEFSLDTAFSQRFAPWD